MRILQQESGARFDYQMFKRRLLSASLTPAQLDPLSQRLEILESFMPPSQSANTGGKGKKARLRGSDWTPKVSCMLYHKAIIY